jgi:hypothetical protein
VEHVAGCGPSDQRQDELRLGRDDRRMPQNFIACDRDQELLSDNHLEPPRSPNCIVGAVEAAPRQRGRTKSIRVGEGLSVKPVGKRDET